VIVLLNNEEHEDENIKYSVFSLRNLRGLRGKIQTFYEAVNS